MLCSAVCSPRPPPRCAERNPAHASRPAARALRASAEPASPERSTRAFLAGGPVRPSLTLVDSELPQELGLHWRLHLKAKRVQRDVHKDEHDAGRAHARPPRCPFPAHPASRQARFALLSACNAGRSVACRSWAGSRAEPACDLRGESPTAAAPGFRIDSAGGANTRTAGPPATAAQDRRCAHGSELGKRVRRAAGHGVVRRTECSRNRRECGGPFNAAGCGV